MEIFWLISDEARVKLIQLQAGYKKKPTLDIARDKAPWEVEPPSPHIDTEIESPEEIGQLMRQPPSRSRGRDG